MMRTSVVVCADRDGIASRALDLVIEGLRAAIDVRGAGTPGADRRFVGGGAVRAAALGPTGAAGRLVARARVAGRRALRAARSSGPQLGRRAARLAGGRRRRGHPGGAAASHPCRRGHRRRPRRRLGRGRATAPRSSACSPGAMAFPPSMWCSWASAATATSSRPSRARRRSPRYGLPAMAVAAPTHIEPHLPRVTLSPFLLAGGRRHRGHGPGRGQGSAPWPTCLTAPARPGAPAGAAGHPPRGGLAAGARERRWPLARATVTRMSRCMRDNLVHGRR